MEKDLNINSDFLDLLWLAKLQETQQTLQEEERLRSEYISQAGKHISFSRSKETAYRPDLRSLAEEQHIKSCSHCEARIRSFQRNLHPLNSALFRYKIGVASEALKAAIKVHLDNQCPECNEKTNGFLGTLAATLATVVTKSKFSLDWVCNQIDLVGENFAVGSKEFVEVGCFSPVSSEYKVSEILNITAKNDTLTSVVQQSPGNEMRLAAISTDPTIKYVYIEVHGQPDSTPIKEIIELEASSDEAFGEKFLPDFDQIIQQLGNNITVLPMPIDETLYKELTSKTG